MTYFDHCIIVQFASVSTNKMGLLVFLIYQHDTLAIPSYREFQLISIDTQLRGPRSFLLDQDRFLVGIIPHEITTAIANPIPNPSPTKRNSIISTDLSME